MNEENKPSQQEIAMANIKAQLVSYYKRVHKYKGIVLMNKVEADFKKVVANADFPLDHWTAIDTIDFLFTWGSSPEGYEYWRSRACYVVEEAQSN